MTNTHAGGWGAGSLRHGLIMPLGGVSFLPQNIHGMISTNTAFLGPDHVSGIVLETEEAALNTTDQVLALLGLTRSGWGEMVSHAALTTAVRSQSDV